MRKLLAVFSFSLLLVSCDSVKEKTKETINQGGEAVGKTATEFFEGVSEGVDRTLECSLEFSQALKDSGLKSGKFSVENDSAGGTNNTLVLYMIFDKDFSGVVTAKSYDKSGLENGRTKVAVEGKAGDAKYYDFVFDKRTYIESRSKITFE